MCLLCYKHISYCVYAAWYWSWWFPLKASLAAAVAKKCIKRENSEHVVGAEFGTWQTGLFVSRGWGKRLEALSRPFPPLPKMVIHRHWRCISYWQRELRAKAKENVVFGIIFREILSFSVFLFPIFPLSLPPFLFSFLYFSSSIFSFFLVLEYLFFNASTRMNCICLVEKKPFISNLDSISL